MGEPGDSSGGEGKGRGSTLQAYMRYLHLGTQMAVILLLGVWGGMKADEHLDMEPVLTVVGSILGVSLGLAVVIREAGRIKD